MHCNVASWCRQHRHFYNGNSKISIEDASFFRLGSHRSPKKCYTSKNNRTLIKSFEHWSLFSLGRSLPKLKVRITQCTWARKLKKVQAKKTREIKKINSSKIVFDQIPFFAISKITKNQFLNWEKFKEVQAKKTREIKKIIFTNFFFLAKFHYLQF